MANIMSVWVLPARKHSEAVRIPEGPLRPRLFLESKRIMNGIEIRTGRRVFIKIGSKRKCPLMGT